NGAGGRFGPRPAGGDRRAGAGGQRQLPRLAGQGAALVTCAWWPVGAAEAASFRSCLAPSPAKAGEGWGGVSPGSARTVGTPSQPPPAFAGGGAKAKLAAPAAPAWLLPPRAILPIPRRCRRYAAARPYQRRQLSRRAAPG